MNIIELNATEERSVKLIQITDQLAAAALRPLTPSTRAEMHTLARKVVDLTISPQ